jgi:hypothetical protein
MDSFTHHSRVSCRTRVPLGVPLIVGDVLFLYHNIKREIKQTKLRVKLLGLSAAKEGSGDAHIRGGSFPLLAQSLTSTPHLVRDAGSSGALNSFNPCC